MLHKLSGNVLVQSSNCSWCGNYVVAHILPRRRQKCRAAVAEYQRSSSAGTAPTQPVQASTVDSNATTSMLPAQPHALQQPTPFPTPSSSPSSPFPTQPQLPAEDMYGHAHTASHSTQTSTIQRLRMVASSLESVEEEEEEEEEGPTPTTSSSPPPSLQAAVEGTASPRGHHTGSDASSSRVQGQSTGAGLKPQPTAEELAARKKVADEENLMVDEISSCESWRDLLEILEDEAGPAGSGLTLFVGVKAISRMASLGRGLPASEKAQLRAEPGFHALARALLSGVPRMKPIQLANSLEAFASLGVIPHTEGMKAYLERCKVCAEAMNGRDLATLLHAFAIMQVRPGRKTLDTLGFRAVHLLRQGEMQPQSLSMLVHACCVLEYKNRVLLAAAADAAVRAMPRLAPQAVSNLAWAFAKLEYYSYAFQRSALKAYAANSAGYRIQEVCNLLWASTRQRFHPEGVLAIMVRSLAENAQQLRGADFASIFLALGTFDVHPGAKMLGQLLGAADSRLTSMQPVELCNIYWGLGLMGEGLHPTAVHIASLLPDHYEANRLNPGLLRQVFTAYLGGKLTLANTGDGADPKLAAAAASISFPTPMMDAMKRAWVANIMSSSMGTAAVEAAASGGSAADSSTGDSQPSQRIESGIRASTSGSSSSNSSSSSSSTGRVVRKPTMAAGASTTTKRALPRIMQALGIRHGIGRPTTDGLVSVDIALRPGPDRFLALQVVEEHEHTANTGQFLGPQRFQSSVLEANGWEVKHVMAKDLRMLDEAAWPAFIAELLRNMGVRVSPDALAAAQARLAQGTRGAISKSVGVGGRYSSSSGSRGLDMLMENGPRERRAVSKRGQQQRGPRR